MSLNLNYKPVVFVEDTNKLTREEWLNYRRYGIGGSDTGAIMGVSPFVTKRDLYYEKVGIKPVLEEKDDNWVAKEVGNRLEDLVAEIFSRKTGFKVVPIRKMFQHPQYPFMLADVDFFVVQPDGSIAILECKTTNYNNQGKWENDAVPINYEYQGMHYMSVTNINKVYFACLFGNSESEFLYRVRERDLETEEALIAEEEYFWNENVRKRVPPKYTEGSDLVLSSIKKYTGPADEEADTVKLNISHITNITKYLELKEEKANLAAQVKKLEEEMKLSYMGIVEEMGTSCKAVLKNGTESFEISYKPSYRTQITSEGLEKMKVNHPDIYDDYVNVTESRRFTVKHKKAS